MEQKSGESVLTVQNGKLSLTWYGSFSFDVRDGLILDAGKSIGRVTASCVGYTVEAQANAAPDGSFTARRSRHAAPAL